MMCSEPIYFISIIPPANFIYLNNLSNLRHSRLQLPLPAIDKGGASKSRR